MTGDMIVASIVHDTYHLVSKMNSRIDSARLYSVGSGRVHYHADGKYHANDN
ncbi:hypothetical protein KM620_gp024 [Hyposidra talaca nucleopolyhedrovirus]|uniref:Uncharacterized protein n=1 Tax=Hyposidra talaca nucleopolyhedrovirus TaxID=1070315 RepID=A0A2Z4HHY2_9ABAC|nr:hypothetical protein KM620_gp024 [Hyposidra talaca nucleopolyhedrovirus]AWW14384.1 hypothetical protein HytaNPV_gp024 [Hyposidra talaca nucleopolyhedrovirus]